MIVFIYDCQEIRRAKPGENIKYHIGFSFLDIVRYFAENPQVDEIRIFDNETDVVCHLRREDIWVVESGL